ncbi:uncharacterized protein [Lolium perenne]|uniref:uncharacterized protein isoform X1 n=1 Tax=Lolium perenne TaxID=4522 RepID=UPI003A9A5CF1
MKNGVEWGKPRPRGSTKIDELSIISDWASLLPELVQGIADCVLSTTGGVDAYMDMRAVCPSWRSAIAKHSPLATDIRFRPRHWVMVDMKPDNDDDDTRLFLHVPTGRFRRLRLPVLRDHILVGATDGLLVLGEKEAPHLARVLNPFTGDMLLFTAPLPEDFKHIEYTALKGGSHCALVFLISATVFCAVPASQVFTDTDFTQEASGPGHYLDSIVNFHGNIYCADMHGWLFELITPEELEVIDQVPPEMDVCREEEFGELRSYLVESDGELLLVCYTELSFKVFRVNIQYMLLEEVKSLGSCALFLGEDRCVSVDADNLPSVDGDCIYMLDYEGMGNMCVYNLRGDTVDIISRKHYLNRPFSLITVLLQYCDFRPLS